MFAKETVLGIDGGGTKTAFTLMSLDGNIIQSFRLAGSSFDTYSPLEIKERFVEAKKQLVATPIAVFAGIGGVLSAESKIKCNQLLSEVFKTEKVASDNDVVNALYGLNPNGEGIILIAGTGSVAFGKKGTKTWRSGGYCYQEGDLGSSYDLGRKALQYLGKTLDARKTETPFSLALRKAIGVNDQIEFASFMEKAKRDQVASLSQIVTAYETEEEAKEIIANAVNEVMLMIDAVYRKLDIKEATPFGIVGGLGNADTFYRTLLLERIEKELPHLVVKVEPIDASKGSAYKALEVAQCNG